MKKVLIKVCNAQTMQGETDKIEMEIVGTIEGNAEDYTIRYTEYDNEMAGCKTTLHVTNKSCVSMIREGSYTTEMMLENGKRHNSHYVTPFGDFTIGIYTKKVESNMEDGVGALSMQYTIDFNTGLAAENDMTITVREGK